MDGKGGYQRVFAPTPQVDYGLVAGKVLDFHATHHKALEDPGQVAKNNSHLQKHATY